MVLSDKEKNALAAGLILAVMLIAVLIYFHFFFFKPAIVAREKEIAKARTEIAAKKKELAEMQAFLKNQAEVEQMEQQLRRAAERLPTQPAPIEFLEELRSTLEETGVKQSRVEPRKVSSRDLYTEIPYLIQGSARYHEFGQFLNLIECNPRRFMRVSGFDLRNNDARPTIHPVSVNISTFMFRGTAGK